ncbi:MAG TPA: hypothetical protein GXZ87_07515 [Bacteroidales bacterium]|nr:hypothetical protein [Bacteroidales bacterium]
MKKHNCISEIRENIKKMEPNVAYVRFDLADVHSDDCNVLMTGQRIDVGIKKKKRNGEEKIVNEKSFVAHNYCPFCGKKYTSF